MISVVIPTYNSEETIVVAIDSVLNQDHNDLEVIVVDDCSSDATCHLITNTRSLGQSIRLIKMGENRGPAAARNRGIKEAKGEWVAFLDGDDVWLPDHLAILLQVAGDNPDAGLVCGAVVPMGRLLDYQTTRLLGCDGESQRAEITPKVIPLREFALRNPVATSAAMVKRQVLEDVGGFDESFRGPEDYDLWMRIAAKCPVVRTSMPVTQYREQVGSLSMDDRRFLPEVLRVYEKAFGDDGALKEFRDLRRSAESGQYWNASWMAFSRGDRKTALRQLKKSRQLNRQASQKTNRPWGRMWLRYQFGKIT